MSILLGSPYNLRIPCHWIVCSRFGRPWQKKKLTYSEALNKTLSHFYLDFGRVFNPDAWLDMNPYHGAFSDHEEEWMNY